MIEFRVLGSLDLRGSEGEEILSILSQPKRIAFLAYLAVSTPRGFHRRDKLVGLFWPDQDQEHARASLRKSLHFLRRSLGDDVILSRGDEEIGLDWAQISCDTTQFEEALTAGDLPGALELYRGELLQGFFLSDCRNFGQWLEAERIRLNELAAGAAWKMAHRQLAAGRITDGERLGQKALGFVGTDENETRRFIAALADAGDRAAAVRFYERFAQVLWDALELEPSSETQAVAARIRASAGASPVASQAPEATGPPPPDFPVAVESSHPSGPEDTQILVQQALAPDLKVIRRIGRGGGAEVYLAMQKPLDRLVAVKVLSKDLANDRVARARFEREAKAAAALDHPNAVAVYRFGWIANEVPYLVMQYVKGGTLEEKLAAEGPLAISDARQILGQVASALAEAHRSGFVHRDVCPENVLCDREAGRVLLSDFGLAGILPEREGSLPRVTRAGEVLGSPGYLSPEQLKGEDPTEGTDVYALGILGYEMLTGEGPFPARNPREVTMGHLRGTPRPLAAVRPDIPSELADLLERCLTKEPGKRPTAGFLAAALTGVGAPSPTDGREGTEDQDVLQALIQRRLPKIVALTGVIGLALLYFVGELTDRGLLPEKAFQFTLDSLACSLAASGIIAWFHGKIGRQRVTPLEVGLLMVVAVIWVAIGLRILFP